MHPVDYSLITEKKCSSCKVVKPADAFGKYDDPKQPINGWRYYSRCLDCSRKASREYGTDDPGRRNARLSAWRKNNPETAFQVEQRKRLKQRYNLTPEDVEVMYAAQGGLCAICGERKQLNMDHDHRTGQVRGGVCTRCNVILGRYELGIPAPHALTKKMLAAGEAYLRRVAETADRGDAVYAPLPKPGQLDECHARVLLEIADGAFPHA